MTSDPTRVLFVCTGNICRSPMAEAVFLDLVQKAGLSEHITADSAGTSGYHVGEAAHTGTLRILQQRGVPYNGRARQLDSTDLQKFDYIVAMDDTHVNEIRALGTGRAKVVRLLDYALSQPLREVPDPYYTGKFDAVYDLVLLGTQGLLDAIRRETQI